MPSSFGFRNSGFFRSSVFRISQLDEIPRLAFDLRLAQMGPRKGIPVLTSRHRTRIVTRDMNVNELIKLPSATLKRILTLKAKIERLEAQLAALVGGAAGGPRRKTRHKRRPLSAAARKRISAAAKARWARERAAKAR